MTEPEWLTIQNRHAKETSQLKADLATLRKHSKEIGRKFVHYYDAFFKANKLTLKLEEQLITERGRRRNLERTLESLRDKIASK